MCGELTCSLGVLRVHDDVRVASKHGSGPAAVLCWTSICFWVGGSSGNFVLDVDLLLGWRVKRQFCVGRRPVVGLAGQAPERWAAGRPVVRCPAGPDHQGQTDGQIGGL